MKIIPRIVFVACTTLLAAGLRASPAANAFLGRWALTLPDGRAGWLEVKQENGWLDGSLLWGGGSVLPVASVTLDGSVLTVTRVRDLPRKNAAGKVVRTHQITETITARVTGDTLALTYAAPQNDGIGFNRGQLTGRRIPPLPPRPNLQQVKFGPPIKLFDGRSLAGWTAKETDRPNRWTIESGALVNRPDAHVAGRPRKRSANLQTQRQFEDFNLRLEVLVPEGSNSGIYLRGLYEVQISDSYGKPLDSHNMGAIYSRMTPSVSAERPAGRWQTLDLTLVDRHATVILNGHTIIDNQPLEGCTGAAMWSDEFRPGPIFLQGDHGPVSYRNLVLRPVVR